MNRSAWLLLTLIIAGEVIFFLPFVLPRIFKPTLLEVFKISNIELGLFFSVYGFVAIGSYLFGGPLADRFSPRRLMSVALLFTAFGGVMLSFIPPVGVLFWLYGFWGMTTILLFWASLMRTTRMIGGQDAQGKAFGFLDGGRGLVAALVSTAAIWILAAFMPGDSENISYEEKKLALQNVIWFFTAFVFIASLVVFIGLKNVEKNASLGQRVSFDKIREVIKKPEVWLQAVIILCAYSGYRVTDDFSLLAKDVLQFNDIDSAKVGSLALWLRPVAAIVAGLTADRFKASTISFICFGLMFFGGLSMSLAPENYYSLTLLVVVVSSTCLGVYAMRGLYFAIMGEAKIPLGITGTVVGIASVVGYLPDIYMAPLMGYFLDKYPGLPLGHQYVFFLLSIFSVLGVLATISFRWVTKRQTMNTLN